MNKQETKTILPRLRFPEFLYDGDWEEKQLDEICEVNPSVKGLPERFVYIDLESVEAGILLQKKIISLEGAPSRAQRLLKIGDVIFQMVRPYQKNNYFLKYKDGFDYVASTGYAQLRAYQSSEYLFQYIHNQRFVDKVLEKCTGSNYPAINSGDLSKIFVEIPKPPEQQKIADCLSSIDDLITSQSKKLDAFKAHKKGLMQQLFPAEGETIPRVRFPEFWNDDGWDLRLLGEITEIVRGGSPRPIEEFLTTDMGGLNWLKIGDVLPDSKYIFGTKEKVIKEALTKTREVNPGDLILSNSMSFGRPYILKIKSCIHDGWIAIRKLSKEIVKDYLYYSISSEGSQSYFQVNAAGAAVKNLNADIIKLLPILKPSISEQIKIADCLSSIDDLLATQRQKIDLLKAHKKGLMQQLFPSTNDIIDEQTS